MQSYGAPIKCQAKTSCCQGYVLATHQESLSQQPERSLPQISTGLATSNCRFSCTLAMSGWYLGKTIKRSKHRKACIKYEVSFIAVTHSLGLSPVSECQWHLQPVVGCVEIHMAHKERRHTCSLLLCWHSFCL